VAEELGAYVRSVELFHEFPASGEGFIALGSGEEPVLYPD